MGVLRVLRSTVRYGDLSEERQDREKAQVKMDRCERQPVVSVATRLGRKWMGCGEVGGADGEDKAPRGDARLSRDSRAPGQSCPDSRLQTRKWARRRGPRSPLPSMVRGAGC